MSVFIFFRFPVFQSKTIVKLSIWIHTVHVKCSLNGAIEKCSAHLKNMNGWWEVLLDIDCRCWMKRIC